ncbi:hypothetical protein BpHYR1_003273 [Brachionus plicatilis]|uniref:Uncharacterized protein n=1 Tax=Brachionus plicatilis TaxID=10195 RepID=A0A3M7RA29_BRAPC|nr:hypothetical protein BpHYR1_003273 [Brachionus plicatilis]
MYHLRYPSAYPNAFPCTSKTKSKLNVWGGIGIHIESRFDTDNDPKHRSKICTNFLKKNNVYWTIIKLNSFSNIFPLEKLRKGHLIQSKWINQKNKINIPLYKDSFCYRKIMLIALTLLTLNKKHQLGSNDSYSTHSAL